MRLFPLILFLTPYFASAQSVPARPHAFLDTKACKALPQVHTVEVSVASKEPKRQIIHILNWHYVPFSDFVADIRQVEGGPPPTSEDLPQIGRDAELDRKWDEFLSQVESVQVEQMDLLRELVKSHKLKQIFLEGFSPKEMPAFKKRLDHLARWKKPDGDTPLNEFLIGMHREDTLEVGAGGRLMMAGELEVIPTEDAEALEAANPVKDGKVQWDEDADERREDAIVRNMLAGESPVAVLILGGGHDLSDNVERIGGGEVEYVRVQVKAHVKRLLWIAYEVH